ncbi:MAG: V-type ATPase subunit [Trueperaceae bacterium]|nr:V-type ATPase subunit [Trueperaceae bacterium]
MSSDYGYINARVRGMKSKLLDPGFYSSALDGSDFRAFMASLSQSPYMRELEEAQGREQGREAGLSAVDRAVARNVYHTARSLLTFSDGVPRELIGLLLLRHDLANAKTIARGKHAQRAAEDIVGSLFPAGEFKPSLLEQAAAAPDMVAAAQLLALTRNPIGSAFLRAARRYQSDNDLFAVELALDQAYYKAVAKGLKEAGAPAQLQRHFQREIDATNLRTALKLRGGGVKADLFVPGGRDVQRATFDAIMADADSGALQALSNGPFAAVAQAAGLPEAETIIRSVLDVSAKRLSADPLDIGVVVDFLRRKEEEAARIRLLARGKFYGVPRAQLEKELAHA